MQIFHYNFIKNKYGNKAEILLTDTDGLMYKIEAENVCEDFCKDKWLFDFSSYPEDLKYYNDANNLVVGKVEDESCGMPVKGFVGLKSKIHTFITEGKYESKKAKTIKILLMVNQNIKITKMFCSRFNVLLMFWDMKWTEFKAKVII